MSSLLIPLLALTLGRGMDSDSEDELELQRGMDSDSEDELELPLHLPPSRAAVPLSSYSFGYGGQSPKSTKRKRMESLRPDNPMIRNLLGECLRYSSSSDFSDHFQDESVQPGARCAGGEDRESGALPGSRQKRRMEEEDSQNHTIASRVSSVSSETESSDDLCSLDTACLLDTACVIDYTAYTASTAYTACSAYTACTAVEVGEGNPGHRQCNADFIVYVP
jgi:hypothetical protein